MNKEPEARALEGQWRGYLKIIEITSRRVWLTTEDLLKNKPYVSVMHLISRNLGNADSMAEYLDLYPQQVLKIISELKEFNLISQKIDCSHKVKRPFELTEHGQNMLDNLKGLQHNSINE